MAAAVVTHFRKNSDATDGRVPPSEKAEPERPAMESISVSAFLFNASIIIVTMSVIAWREAKWGRAKVRGVRAFCLGIALAAGAALAGASAAETGSPYGPFRVEWIAFPAGERGYFALALPELPTADYRIDVVSFDEGRRR